jgi:hypothetical protein
VWYLILAPLPDPVYGLLGRKHFTVRKSSFRRSEFPRRQLLGISLNSDNLIAFIAALTLLSVLLKHAAYLLHQLFELPHPVLPEAMDAFLLEARYDLIGDSPHFPPSLR